MADRTSQPADGVGVNALYNTAIFLWNGVAPTKNQIDSATVTAKGTSVSGADGQYQRMSNVDGAMSWTATAPATAYTLVALIVFPQASSGPGILLAIPGAVRIEPYTTGGGAYIPLTQSGVAAASNIFVESAPMDSEMWTYVARYTGTQLVQYLKRGDGTVITTTTETIGYSGAGSNQVDIGDQFGNPGLGLYAAMVVPSDIGDTQAQAIRDNGWRIFAEISTGFTITADNGTYSLAGQDVGLRAARTVSADPGTYSLTGQDVTLTKETPGAFVLTAESGTYLWTGQDALADYAMNADGGAYSLAGQDITFSRTFPQAYTLTAEGGIYAWTGRSVRLAWSGEPIVPSRGAGIYMGMRIGL